MKYVNPVTFTHVLQPRRPVTSSISLIPDRNLSKSSRFTHILPYDSVCYIIEIVLASLIVWLVITCHRINQYPVL